MTILGVGTDILFLPRIVSLVKRRSQGRLASRILSVPEHKHWLSLRSSTEKIKFLAVRWSVKEAAFKALQPGSTLKWKQLIFLNDPESTSRKPDLQLTQELREGVILHASVSHDGDHVIAMVVAETTATKCKGVA